MRKEETFWNWFMANNSRYYYLNKITNLEKEKLLDEFLNQLHNYSDKLFFQIGGDADGPQELIISADGNKDFFEKVESLVAKAPEIDNWKIIAFKQPIGIIFVTEYENVKIDPKEIWFLPLENEDNPQDLGLRLYLPNYSPKKENIFIEGCYQVLDTMLGEKSVALDVQHVEVNKLPENPKKEGLIKLADLSNYITWRKTKK